MGADDVAADDYTIDGYHPRDKEALCRLQTYLWSGDPDLNRAYLEWKYEQNPYMEEPLISVARTSDGEVVGMAGMFGNAWTDGDSTHVIPCSGDVVVHPDHRARGLFSALTTRSRQEGGRRGYRYATNLSANWLAALGYQSQGWQLVGSLEPVRRYGTRPLARLKQVGRSVPGVLSWWRDRQVTPASGGIRPGVGVANPFSSLDAARLPSPLTLEATPDPDDLAGSGVRIGNGRLRQLRDAAFYRWRLASPLAAYRILRRSGAAGHVILQCSRIGDGRRAHLVELAVPDPAILKRMIDVAARRGGFDHLTTWAVSLDADVRTTLDASGFRRLDEGTGVQASRAVMHLRRLTEDDQPWTLGGRPLLTMDAWDVGMLDADVV